MLHGCGFTSQSGVLWLRMTSDACSGLSCYGIALVMAYFTRQRKDLLFPLVLRLFFVFIVLRGTFHLMAIWLIWSPAPYAEGWLKAATAAVSASMLGVLILSMPKALNLVGTAQLAAQNAKLSEELGQAEERGRAVLSAVVDNVFDGIITTGEDGIIKSFNPACSRLFGYKPEEVIGKDIKLLMPRFEHVPHDRHLQTHPATGMTPGHQLQRL